MGVNVTTIVYLRVLIIQIGSTIILMVVEAQGLLNKNIVFGEHLFSKPDLWTSRVSQWNNTTFSAVLLLAPKVT